MKILIVYNLNKFKWSCHTETIIVFFISFIIFYSNDCYSKSLVLSTFLIQSITPQSYNSYSSASDKWGISLHVIGYPHPTLLSVSLS